MNPENSAELVLLLGELEQASSSESLVSATRNLAQLCPSLVPHSSDQKATINALMGLLAANNPGAAVAAVEGLIACGKAAVEPLLHNLDEHNYGARAWAVRALASIGDPRGLPVLERAVASDIGPSVRRAAARGLGNLSLASTSASERELLVERCLSGLAMGCADGEWVVRYAAVVGLDHFLRQAAEPWRSQGQNLLVQRSQTDTEDTPAVRLRAQVALEQFDPASSG